jgi:hypothetical protein
MRFCEGKAELFPLGENVFGSSPFVDFGNKNLQTKPLF